MRLSSTLSVYIGRNFLYWLAITVVSLSFIILLFDMVELLRRASNKPDATFEVLLNMSLLKLPNMVEIMFPFAVLFGGMITFTKLTRSQELIVARSSGISVWQFMLPTMVVAFILGIIMLTLFNPLASTFLSKYETMESRFLSGQESQIAIIEDGVWLRQAIGDTQSVINATRLSQKDLTLQEVTIFQFQENDKFIARIDASHAKLEEGFWQLKEAWASDLKSKPQYYEKYSVPTNLTRENILNSFSTPETLSFWELPKFIAVLEKAGFSAIRHKLHLNSLIALPVLLCAMVLISASCSLQPPRKGQTLTMLTGGIAAGFILFFVNDIVTALGMSARIPIMMAAWTPSVIAILFGVAFLLHMEDG